MKFKLDVVLKPFAATACKQTIFRFADKNQMFSTVHFNGNLFTCRGKRDGVPPDWKGEGGGVGP